MSALGPAEITIFHHLFAAVAEEMGIALMRSAFSSNIKERRDFSCALFDGEGTMIAHAAHIPVHLGSTPMSVAAVRNAMTLGPGDIAIVNDPYQGGTHLPDVTVVAPVFLPGGRGDAPDFYVADRAHHADVGGKSPGSMSVVEHIDDEGVRLEPSLLIREHARHAPTWERFLGAVRAPHEREGDLLAQCAALSIGARRLGDLAERYTPAGLADAGRAVVDYSARLMAELIADFPDGSYTFQDHLDDDGAGGETIPIRVRVDIQGDRLCCDFNGSAPQVKGPLNAVEAITRSAVFYVLRCLAPADMPSNDGLMRPVEVRVPLGTVVNARPPSPVAGGNVETSQRIVDVLFGALAQALPERIPAASQGTMNNLACGGEHEGRSWTYYETIAGGAGAGRGKPGASGVQTHMTNTLNTPVEALEHSFPLRITRYRLRRDSGGSGEAPGGEGVERGYRFLDEAQVTLLTERRQRAPWGLAGGGDGATGRNSLRREGETRPLPAKTTLEVRAGDEIVIETPGGGAWGASPESR